MDYLTYLSGVIALITVAILSSWFTAMIYKEKILRLPTSSGDLWVRQVDAGELRTVPQRWFWWVGTDPQRYLIAVVASSEYEAKLKLGPKNLDLIRSARVKGSKGFVQGYSVLVARSPSEINVEGV